MRILIETKDTKCTVEQEGITLDDTLALFTQALRGMGYYFDGEVVIDDTSNNAK